VKCEFLNPSGSVKDRFARHVVEHAEKNGLLHEGSAILEVSSGNTGISLAMVGAAKGYPVTILMSKGASCERAYIIKQFGAELILFEATQGYRTGIDIAEGMAAKDERYFLPRQFENPLNAEDHEFSTALEILSDVPGPIKAFVAGYGTGGTLAGVGKGIKKAYPEAKIIAMEPAEAAMLCGEMPCCHNIEGIAGGFLPPLLRSAPLDGEIAVHSDAAMSMARRLNREFGLLVGTSSGANVAAAVELAKDLGPDNTVVTLLCDRAERYFSTRLFEKDCPE
jgi:cysteine synthase